MRDLIEYNRENGVYPVAPENWDVWIDERIAQVEAGNIPPGEFRRADGKVYSYQCVALPDGGRMLTYFDITERKRSDEALQAALSEFNAVIDSIDYGIIFMGPDLRTRLVNKAFRNLWGIPDSFVAGSPHMRDLIEYNRENGVYPVAPDPVWGDRDELTAEQQRLVDAADGRPLAEITEAPQLAQPLLDGGILGALVER